MLAGVVVWSVTTAVHPPPPATRLVVTARHDLGSGTTLSASDLALVPRPEDALARDAAGDLAALDGRVVAVPGVAGEVVRARDVVGRSLLAALGPDVVATPVRLSDDAGLASVRAGDIVDVVAARGSEGEGTGMGMGMGTATGTATASVVATRVRVLTVGATSASGGGLLGGTGSTSAPVLLLATTSAQAIDIAAAVVGSRLSVTLRSA